MWLIAPEQKLTRICFAAGSKWGRRGACGLSGDHTGRIGSAPKSFPSRPSSAARAMPPSPDPADCRNCRRSCNRWHVREGVSSVTWLSSGFRAAHEVSGPFDFRRRLFEYCANRVLRSRLYSKLVQEFVAVQNHAAQRRETMIADQIDRFTQFGFIGQTLIRQPERATDLGCRFVARVAFDSFSKDGRLLQGEAAVEQVEGLQRRGGLN